MCTYKIKGYERIMKEGLFESASLFLPFNLTHVGKAEILFLKTAHIRQILMFKLTVIDRLFFLDDYGVNRFHDRGEETISKNFCERK